ncbi:MAG: hypothetical protein SVX38_01540 [Chloroflexota bacterium]|nr:hypothetical protein [Chloroflexota bacterium]
MKTSFLRLACIITLAGLALTACNPIKREDPRLDFTKILPEELRAQQVERLDADNDGHLEWVLFYQYDVIEGQTRRQFSPIAAVVYNADAPTGRKEPPVIQPYPLHPPDEDYLGENQCEIRMADVIAKNDGLELVVESIDANGLITDASIFTWRGDEEAGAGSPGYKCLGFFRTRGQVEVSSDRVVVRERTDERSQLAVRQVYQPKDGSYLDVNDRVLAPIESSVEFAFGKPKDVLNSPYPEKIVLAFYQDINTDAALDYLSADGRERLIRGELDLGAPWSRSRIAKTLVRELRYIPPAVGSPETQVSVRVSFRPTTGEESEVVELTWVLIQEGGFWKMDQSSRTGESATESEGGAKK